MGSDITDEHFLIQVLKSLTIDYEFQMSPMEKRICDKMNPLSIDELKKDLNLRYERLSSKSESTKHENFGRKDDVFYKIQRKRWKLRQIGSHVIKVQV
jgi:hypothetical protein